MGGQGAQNLSFGPPAESSLRKALVAKPKPLTVISHYTNGRSLPVREHKYSAREGIGLEYLPADAAQAIDAGPKVHRIYSHKDTHLRSYLDHGLLQNVLAASTSPASTAPLTLMRILAPSGRSTSMIHSGPGII